MERTRKVKIKISNSSSYDLVSPRWALVDGKTEVNPEFIIRGEGGVGEGGMGEAVFQGHTLKGLLTYEIAARHKFALMVIFKVPWISEIELLKTDCTLNQAGAKVLPISDIDTLLTDKNGMYKKHEDAMEYCTGRYHACVPDDEHFNAPRIIARFSISDTGDIYILVQEKNY